MKTEEMELKAANICEEMRVQCELALTAHQQRMLRMHITAVQEIAYIVGKSAGHCEAHDKHMADLRGSGTIEPIDMFNEIAKIGELSNKILGLDK